MRVRVRGMVPHSAGHACGFVKATCAACAQPVAAACTQPVDRARDGVRVMVRVGLGWGWGGDRDRVRVLG